MRSFLKSFLRFLIFLSIGVIILYFIYDNLNTAYLEDCALKGIPEESCSLMQKLIDDFASASKFWLLIVILTFMLRNIIRAIRWQMLLRPLGYEVSMGNSFFAIMLGYFANLGLPRMGEFIRAGALARNENIPFERSMGTIVVDRVMDFICLGIMLVLGFLFNFTAIWKFVVDSPLMQLTAYWYIMLILFLLGLGFLWRIRRWLKSEKIGPAWIEKIKDITRGFAEGLSSVRKVDNIPLFLFYSGAIWFLYYLMTYLCFFAYEPTSHLPPVAGLIVFDLGAIGMVIPSPGGMGTYHYMLMQGLLLFGVDRISGFAFANILFFSIQIFCNIAFGLLALAVLPRLKKKNVITETQDQKP
ncbi:MAG: lysylphosphatidylglycerol synthase transmembrane domain-containing protein [Saprospiraceae bacterium]|nr:lysylphosphatidylglycerol synthase transmembrane domain-containing protein [Saprospiraceae bacterium]